MMKGFFIPIATVCFLTLYCHAAFANKIVLKINMGGGALGDFKGEDEVFDLDSDDYKKQVSRTPIQQTAQIELFQTQRFARSKELTIRLPVADGIYAVTLLMAETYEPACRPGGRVFDISFGTPTSGLQVVAPHFDLFTNAGCLTAFGKRFENLPAKDGLIVSLSAIKQHPSLAGLIVEGFPVPKGDGSEYKAIAQMSPDRLEGGEGFAGGDAPAGGEAHAGDGTWYGAGEDTRSGAAGGVEAPGAPSGTGMGMAKGAGVMGGGLGQAPQRRRLLDASTDFNGRGHHYSQRHGALKGGHAFHTPGRFSLPAPPLKL